MASSKSPQPPPLASLRFQCLAVGARPNEPLFHFLPFLSNRFLPSALGVVGSSRVWAHVRVGDHVHTGACAGSSRHCGVRAPPPHVAAATRCRTFARQPRGHVQHSACTSREHDREPAVVLTGTRSVVTSPAFFPLPGPPLARGGSGRERPRPNGRLDAAAARRAAPAPAPGWVFP